MYFIVLDMLCWVIFYKVIKKFVLFEMIGFVFDLVYLEIFIYIFYLILEKMLLFGLSYMKICVDILLMIGNIMFVDLLVRYYYVLDCILVEYNLLVYEYMFGYS